jgi:hypothetical protein
VCAERNTRDKELIRRAYRWNHGAAHVLANPDQQPTSAVLQAFVRVLRSIRVAKWHCGRLEAALNYFFKVSRSYQAGLFHYSADPALPITSNALEQCFGQHRYHERRASGRKPGAPNEVVHDSVRLVAGTATRLRRFSAADLAPSGIVR